MPTMPVSRSIRAHLADWERLALDQLDLLTRSGKPCMMTVLFDGEKFQFRKCEQPVTVRMK
jgi:hypothetical protein